MSNRYYREKAKFSNLVENRPTATGAQRTAKSRMNMTEEEKDNERSANRERMAQPEALAADKARKEARRQDPAQPETYMVARRTSDIFSGKLIVPEVDIGQLGDVVCPGCGALHFPGETSQSCCGWRCPCSKGNWNCDCAIMCHNPDKQIDGGCCGLKVRLPPFPAPPELLQALWNLNLSERK